MDERARRRLYCESHRVGNRVVDVDKLDAHAAELDGLARVDDMHLRLVEQAVLTQLVAHQSEGERRSVERYVDPREKEGKSADMVLMTVGQDDASHLVGVLLDIGKVRYHQIDAQHVAVRERHAAVHDQHIALALDQGDILADLVESAEKGNPD